MTLGFATGASGLSTQGLHTKQAAGSSVTSFIVDVTSVDVTTDGTTWTPVYQPSPPVAVELIQASGQSVTLSNVVLDPGHYKGLRFSINGGTVVNNGHSYAIPATTFPMLQDFDVVGKKVTGLTIDFGLAGGTAPITVDNNAGTATIQTASISTLITALTLTFIPTDTASPQSGGIWMSGDASGTYDAQGNVKNKGGTTLAAASFGADKLSGTVAFTNGRKGTFQVTSPGNGGTFSGGASGVFVARPDRTGGTWYVNSESIATAEGTFTYKAPLDHTQGGTFSGDGKVQLLGSNLVVNLGGTFTETSGTGGTGGDWSLTSAKYLGTEYIGFFRASPGYVLDGSFLYS